MLQDILLVVLGVVIGAVLGFFFAKTLNKTDNIFCTIMMHMMHNGILTILAMVI